MRQSKILSHYQNSLEQLQDGHHDVIDVAEAGRLELLGVVQPAGPVDGDVARVVVQLGGAVQRGARVHRTEVVQAVEHRTANDRSGSLTGYVSCLLVMLELQELEHHKRCKTEDKTVS